jgi:hypothetical protein
MHRTQVRGKGMPIFVFFDREEALGKTKDLRCATHCGERGDGHEQLGREAQ